MFISGVSLQLGDVTLPTLLESTELTEAILAHLKSRGIDRFVRQDAKPEAVMLRCIHDTISKTGAAAASVDSVILSSTLSSQEQALLPFKQLELEPTSIYQLALKDCTASISAIHFASALLNSEQAEHTLVVINWTSSDGRRLSSNQETLYGDGTLSFIASNKGGEFEVLASDLKVDPRLVGLEAGMSNRAAFLLASLDNIQRSAEQVLRRAGVDIGSLRAVFCTNANAVVQDAIGMTTKMDAIIFRDCLYRYGHVYACDEFLGLATYVRERDTRENDLFLLVSWGPYAAGACVLQQCGAGLRA
jgi:3-oxoacyl-[acyl-carrier-protein] synthase III